MSNDRINMGARDLGYHCAYCYLAAHTGKYDSHKRVARALKVAYSTIEYNRRKMRAGKMSCPLFKEPGSDPANIGTSAETNAILVSGDPSRSGEGAVPDAGKASEGAVDP